MIGAEGAGGGVWRGWIDFFSVVLLLMVSVLRWCIIE